MGNSPAEETLWGEAWRWSRRDPGVASFQPKHWAAAAGAGISLLCSLLLLLHQQQLSNLSTKTVLPPADAPRHPISSDTFFPEDYRRAGLNFRAKTPSSKLTQCEILFENFKASSPVMFHMVVHLFKSFL